MNDDSPMGRGCTFEPTLRSGDEKTVGIGNWWNGVSEDEQAQSTKGWFLSFEFESISFDLNLLWVEFILKKVWHNYWLKRETIFKICIPKKNMQTIKRCWGVETLVIGQETPKLSWGSVLPTFLWNSGRWQVFYMSSTASQQMILACFTILAPHYESQGQVSGQGSVFKVFLEFCETAC